MPFFGLGRPVAVAFAFAGILLLLFILLLLINAIGPATITVDGTAFVFDGISGSDLVESTITC